MRSYIVLLFSAFLSLCLIACDSHTEKAEKQYLEGVNYKSGNGVEKSDTKAEECFRQAAALFRKGAGEGDAKAYSGMGKCYYNGHGVKQSYKEAAKWYRIPAERGDVDAQCRLGL